MKVVIIGAGLSGLALTHGLRQAGIDAHVFERHGSAADRPASYGIHLNADGLRALHGCLPQANWKSLDAAAVPAPDVRAIPRPSASATADRRSGLGRPTATPSPTGGP